MIYIMCGPPGAGKSTWAYNFQFLSEDGYLTALNQGFEVKAGIELNETTFPVSEMFSVAVAGKAAFELSEHACVEFKYEDVNVVLPYQEDFTKIEFGGEEHGQKPVIPFLPIEGDLVTPEEYLQIGKRLEGTHPYSGATFDLIALQNGELYNSYEYEYAWQDNKWVRTDGSDDTAEFNSTSLYGFAQSLKDMPSDYDLQCRVNPFNAFVHAEAISGELKNEMNLQVFWDEYGCMTYYHINQRVYGHINGEPVEQTYDIVYNISYTMADVE